MSLRTLSTPTVIINNETYPIVPNSFTYDGGEGEINVRSASSGGGSVQSVHSLNAETMIGVVKFDVYLTTTLDRSIARWKEDIGANTIQAIQRNGAGGSVTLSFDNMSLTNAVERDAGADGVTTLEWAGDTMSIQ